MQKIASNYTKKLKVFFKATGNTWRILIPVKESKFQFTSPILLIYGFGLLIAIGTILLVFPFSSANNQSAGLVNAFFTAASSVCVTGLTVLDTGSHWSQFGQIVIFILIQIGGFGLMTSATLFLLLVGRNIGLREKLLISDSIGMLKFGGIIGLIKKMAIFTVICELAGACTFFLTTFNKYAPAEAAWRSLFHSVSSFNNAGFDLFGNNRSLMDFSSDAGFLLVTALLVIAGGISFFTIMDIFKSRRFTRLTLDSKLVLVTTAGLLIAGTAVILVTEYFDPNTMGPFSLPDKVLNSFFQAVTARTAGFSTINISGMANYTLFFTMILMFIGGASGSTAGGIKVNNFSIIAATIWGAIKGSEHPGAFGREFIQQQIHRAMAVILLSMLLIAAVVFSLTFTENFKFIDLLFETVSAFGTVGLSTGITPGLSTAGRVIIGLTMFAGRLGPLTIALVLTQRQVSSEYRFPTEPVRIG